MTIATARNELAAGVTAGALGVYGYARPPGQIAKFPAAVVQDPTRIEYHTTLGRRSVVTLDVRVVVGRAAAEDQVAKLDELVTFAQMPALLESISGSWLELAVTELAAGYSTFMQGGQAVGVAADLTCELTFNL